MSWLEKPEGRGRYPLKKMGLGRKNSKIMPANLDEEGGRRGAGDESQLQKVLKKQCC